jgi:para-nitrobenzyl esterase
MLSQPASANPPLKVSINSCPGRTVTGFVGDFPPRGVHGAMRQFLGIPYAAPPTGANRWQPPKSFCWTGNRKATAFGDICPNATGGLNPGSENCLFLNIFTPPTGTYSDLPVMVYFHPGSFIASSGSDNSQNPIDLVNQNLIVVTLNYRLGALGFLAHPALDKGPENTGNYGILDQQAALKWVKQNISAFGGDPKNVTIFGESAGALSVLTHLVSPLAEGLFDKAILESGELYQAPTPLREAEKDGKQFAADVGCKTAKCLRALPVRTIVENQRVIHHGDTEMIKQDGVVVTDSFQNLLMSGKFQKVPIISGTNHDDGRRFMVEKVQLGTGGRCDYVSNIVPTRQATFPGAVKYRDALAGHYSPRLVPLVEAQYPSGPTPLSANIAYWAADTDSQRSCRFLRMTDWMVQNGAELYAYEFNDADAPLFSVGPVRLHNGDRFPLGAYDGAELQYIFRQPDTVGCQLPYAGLSAAQQTLSDSIIAYWTRFAKTGNPNQQGAGSPHWPLYRQGTRKMLSLVAPRPKVLQATAFDDDHLCSAFWNDPQQ